MKPSWKKSKLMKRLDNRVVYEQAIQGKRGFYTGLWDKISSQQDTIETLKKRIAELEAM